MKTEKNQKKLRIDEQKIRQFVSTVMHDLDATANCALAHIGDKLGLYKAMAEAEDSAVTSRQLASITKTNERYIRDWLAEQASKRYIVYDPTTGKYTLPKEHAAVLADESSHTYMAGGFQLLISVLRMEPRISEAFCTGEGIDWEEYDTGVFEGQARLNGTLYKANLVDKWIPALEDIEEKLRRKDGAKVADVGCGYGVSTTIMAKAYPNSSFVGFDNHAYSIERARERAMEDGLANTARLRFEVASSDSFGAHEKYDLVAFFDCLHDMGDPYAVARHAKHVLEPDGTLMLVEMASKEKLEENIESPSGTNGYAGSIFVCLPNALAQMKKSAKDRDADLQCDVLPLGGMAGISTIEKLIRTSGFSKFRCALNDGLTMILEARP